GRNLLPETRRRRWVAILAEQFKDLMVLLLIAAAVIAAVIGEAQDTVVILVIILLNGTIGFVQQMRSERAMAALRRLVAAKATVCRDGRNASIAAADLVVGDLVVLEAGDLVPADLRLVECADL